MLLILNSEYYSVNTYTIPRLSWNLNLMFSTYCQVSAQKNDWLSCLTASLSNSLKQSVRAFGDRVSFGDYISLLLDNQKLYFYSSSKFVKKDMFSFIIFVLTQFSLIEIDELLWWASEIYFYWIMYTQHIHLLFTFKLKSRQNGNMKHFHLHLFCCWFLEYIVHCIFAYTSSQGKTRHLCSIAEFT